MTLAKLLALLLALCAAVAPSAGAQAGAPRADGAREAGDWIDARWPELGEVAARAAAGEHDAARELLASLLGDGADALLDGLDDDRAVELLVRLDRLAATCGSLELQLTAQEALHSLRVRTLPADHVHLLVAKSNLAATRTALGDARGAIELFEQVYETWEPRLGPDHRVVLTVALNIAALQLQLDQPERALESLEHVCEVWGRTKAPDDQELLVARHNLAQALSEVGDVAGARAVQERILATQERLLPADHPRVLAAQHALAWTLRRLGDLEGALELSERACAGRERTLPRDHPDLLATRHELTATLCGLGDVEECRASCAELLELHAARALGLAREAPRTARSAAIGQLAQLEWALYWSEWLEQCGAEPLEARAFEAVESLRAVATSSLVYAHAAARSPEVAARARELSELGARLAARSQDAPSSAGALDAWRAELVDLSVRRDGVERALRAAVAGRGVPTSPLTAASVAAGLEPDAGLVGFLRYRRHALLDREVGDEWSTSDALLAFAVRPDGAVRRVELGAAEELEELAAAWRARLGASVRRGVVPDAVSALDEPAAGRALRRRLLDPCLAAFGAAPPARLHVVLDDFLHLVPLDALPTDGDARLGATLELCVESSVARLAAKERQRAELAGTLVALGGADFGAAEAPADEPPAAKGAPPSPAARPAAAAFAPLVQSRFEAETVGALYEELEGAEPALLTRGDATKARLIELAPRARWLHVATHGWFAPESAAQSLLDRADADEETRASVARAQGAVEGFLPETLCGLALAGANRGAGERGRAPGILTAEELGTLDLSGCELAVLSACETNVGIRRAGQGIRSLQSALHAAGARTAITSLWRVDDAAARRLFELFYTRLWKDGLGKAAALWSAKSALRAEGHPPRDWAGWVLTGEPD